jgi:excisionase family DNA binding protein
MPSTKPLADRLLTPVEAAQYLQLKVETLATWRANHRYDLPYVRVGTAIRYRLSDLQKWLESRTVGAAS